MKDSKKLVFFDADHSYWFEDKQIPSVGSILSKYFPFSESYWLTHSALKSMLGVVYEEHYKSFSKFKPDAVKLFPPMLEMVCAHEFSIEKSKFSDKWKRKRVESAYKGTRFHAERENEAYSNGFLINPFDGKKYNLVKHDKEYDNESLSLNLFDLEDGAYPELMVFPPNMAFCGQSDEVYIETVDGVRYFDINDHKTNEEKPSKSSPDRMIAPFNHLYASKHNHYAFQMSMYAHALELHGFTPRKLAYTFYKNYDVSKAQLVELDFFKEEVMLILEELC